MPSAELADLGRLLTFWVYTKRRLFGPHGPPRAGPASNDPLNTLSRSVHIGEDLAFPDAHYLKAEPGEQFRNAPFAISNALELSDPDLAVRPTRLSARVSGTTVPVAAVRENGDLCGGENDVRSHALSDAAMDAVSKPTLVKRSAQKHLGHRIAGSTF